MIPGLLVTLFWEFGNMRSDYVIYLPSLQDALVERQKISKRSLKDSFILDRGCLANKKEAKEEEEAEEVDINISKIAFHWNMDEMIHGSK